MISIRRACAGDEAGLAKVHIQAWQEAYQGLIPQSYLDNLPSEFIERAAMWESIIQNPKRWAWVAESDQSIVGFILFGPPRDQNRDGFVELGAIYLLATEKNKGIGFSLLKTGFSEMSRLGFKRAYCWVLQNNSTTEFYKRTGALHSGLTKEDEIGGKIFKELAYEWKSLDLV